MPAHSEERHFNYTTPQLFELVSGVEKYSEFLPWVKAVRVRERTEAYFIADVVVHFKHITEKYTCRVDLTEPTSESEPGEIQVSLVSGPFHHLTNHWRFEPSEGGCEVQFHVDFQFKTPFLDKIIGLLFDRATRKMVSAFEERAHALYGTHKT